jgi:hypothetical protein
LEDAIKEWETKYKQFYEHIENGDQMYHYDEDKHDRIISKLKEQNYSVIDPVMLGWTQGVIDTLEWVLQVPDDKGTLWNWYPKERYRKFMQATPIKEE